MAPLPHASPPLKLPSSSRIVLLTLSCLHVPLNPPYPCYALSTQSEEDLTFLVDSLRLPATSSLPCAALLSPWGLEVLSSPADSTKTLGLSDLVTSNHSQFLRHIAPPPQLRLMISGSSSHCGKTTFTLLLLECLRRSGLRLGYLKPTTQCEAESIVTKYCKNAGVRTKVRFRATTRSMPHGSNSLPALLRCLLQGFHPQLYLWGHRNILRDALQDIRRRRLLLPRLRPRHS